MAHAMRGKIGEAVEIVVEHTGQRVGVGAFIVKSRRAASSRQSVLKATVARRPSVETSRRSVVISTGSVIDHRRHRAMGNAGGHGLEARAPDPLDDILRAVNGCDVDILDRQAEQAIAHGTADEACLAIACAKSMRKAASDRSASATPHPAISWAGRPSLRFPHGVDAAREIDENGCRNAPDAPFLPEILIIAALAALPVDGLGVRMVQHRSAHCANSIPV